MAADRKHVELYDVLETLEVDELGIVTWEDSPEDAPARAVANGVILKVSHRLKRRFHQKWAGCKLYLIRLS